MWSSQSICHNKTALGMCTLMFRLSVYWCCWDIFSLCVILTCCLSIMMSLTCCFWQLYWKCLGTPAALRQRREGWGAGSGEVLCFWRILIKAGRFNHRLISIREEREGRKQRQEGREAALQTNTTRGFWKHLSWPEFFLLFPISSRTLSVALAFFLSLFLFFFLYRHRIFLFLFISVPMAPTIPYFFCPWSAVQCYCQL